MGKNKKVDNPIIRQKIKDSLKKKRRLSKQLSNQKRARLIVKNLSFKATEDGLKSLFEKYGEVQNVDLLKKPDGKLVGCAFVQFKLVQLAAKARHYANNQPFLGRNITVDFAKSKDKYKQEKSATANEEVPKKDNTAMKDDIDELIEVKDETKEDVKIESDEEHDDLEDAVLKEESDSDTNSECESMEDNQIVGASCEKSRVSYDVNEGKTIFVKNLPFQAKNDDLRRCFSQFGPIYYALICVDKLTEHSRGTGFVKFLNKEDSEKALSAGTELTLLGNILDCHPALQKDELNKKFQKEKDDRKKPKDSRNLFLVKEGVILAGTKAAEGVSASDMAKRLEIEQYKTQMLRKLNTFVARDRLVIHNLPPTWDDHKLKALFLKHGGKGAFVKEARVMRDMRHLDASGIGPSKEYGFVTFSSHENALQALRSLNNNPNVFSAQKRPIITFSIESKTALNAKIKRLEKSKQKNPKSKQYDPEIKVQIDIEKNPKCRKYKPKVITNETRNDKDNMEELESFVGVASREGQIQKMRGRYKLSTQAKIHAENLKKEKRKRKTAKKSLEQKKKDFIKQPKQKIRKKNQEDNFSKMVTAYKSKILNASVAQKRKWTEY